MPAGGRSPRSPPLTLEPDAARRIRNEIARAGGREVCFLARVTGERRIVEPRAVARGNHEAVLAAARDAEEGGVMLHNHPSGLLEPSEADLRVASRLYEQGLGTVIVDSEASELYVVVEPPAPRRREPLDREELDALLGPDGPLAGLHSGYEDRPGQREMLARVAERYDEGGVLLVEAGTGTGKSLAYLLPAAAWALRNGERTIVSTNTINLQEQLVGNDLPLVERVLAGGGIVRSVGPSEPGREAAGRSGPSAPPASPDDVAPPGLDDAAPAGAEAAAPAEPDDVTPAEPDDVAPAEPDDVAPADADAAAPADPGAEAPPRPLRWALVKGRGNYVSIRRALLAAESQASLFEDDHSEELAAVLEWIGATEDGSLSDLPFLPSGDTWEEVQSDADICLRARCPHFQACFYQRSRRRAASADVLVVNHHLLFSDLALRRATDNWSDSAVLPAYRRVVLDEAHNLEDAATSHLGVQVTRRGLFRLLSRLERNGKGIVPAIEDRLAGDPEEGEAAALLDRLRERVRPAAETARAALERFYDVLEPALPEAGEEALRIGAGEPGKDSAGEPIERVEVREILDALLARLADLEREVGELRRRVELDPVWEERLEGRLLDLKSVERRLETAAGGLRLVLAPSEDAARSHVRWVEWRGRDGGGGERRRRPNLALAAAPIELGPILRESLFGKVDTAVLSSATLATRRDFDFLRRRIGLDAAVLEEADDAPEVVESIVPSPFDFASQTLFCVPAETSPTAVADDAFQRATADAVAALAEVTGGGVFVLFTSHRALRRVAALLRESGAQGRWPLFVHGEDDRARLLAGFTASGRGILLGTASFWEGVDVPGDPLRGLVLQKLPFRVPTEPVTAARVEAIERAGGNAFWEFMLPLAALRLKQGFGRLIRSRDDRGAVLLLDSRILTRRYGRYLRESLPEAPLVKGPWPEVERALRAFYGGRRDG